MEVVNVVSKKNGNLLVPWKLLIVDRAACSLYCFIFCGFYCGKKETYGT